MNKSKKVAIQKTDKLDGQKLHPIAARYNIAPIDVRELQLGFTIEVFAGAADEMIAASMAKKAKDEPRSPQEKVDALTVTPEDGEQELVQQVVDTKVTIADTDVVDDDESEEVEEA
jgi:hypothetical protein